MIEEHLSDLLAGYALGILDAAERSHVQEHLRHYEVCRQEYAAYAETAERLAQVTVHPIPTPTLKLKVLNRVQAASAGQTASFSETESEHVGFRDVLRSFFQQPLGMTMGVLGVLVIVVLGVSTLLLRQEVKELQAQLPGGYMQVVRLEGTDLAPDTSGYVMVFRNQKYGSLAVTHAPLLAEDEQYQIWLIKDGIRTSGGVFSVNEEGYGNLMVAAEQPLDSFDAFGITIEPVGGSPQPTGDKVLGN